jgi:hypothetical protein
VQIVIGPDGVGRCVYHESIDLAALGSLSITRASHVEPTADDQWIADLAPVGGPELSPFSSRSVALAAESAWLEANWLATGRS